MERLIKILLSALVAFVGCKTQPPVTQVPINYRERIVERLVPVKINEDSLKLRARFECDSLNNVVMRGIDEQKSKGIESQFSFENDMFNYNVATVHDTIYIAAKDSFIYQEIPVRVAVPVEVNKLTKLQVIQIRAGKAMFWLLGAGGVYLLVLKRSIVFPFLLKLLKWLKSLF